MAIAYLDTTFGAVGDGVTNNDTAMAAAISWSNSNNTPVIVPTGKWLYNTAPSAFNTSGAGFIGMGTGSIMQFNGTSGNSLTLDGVNGANGMIIKNLSFSPVKFRNSGAEIALINNPIFSIIENISAAYINQLFNIGASTVTTIRDINSLFSYSPTIQMKGTGSGSGLMNGIVLDNIWTGIGNEVSGISYSSWTSSHAYNVGDQIIANGVIWTCIHAGTSASSGIGPVETSYTLASDPWFAQVTDGTVKWSLYCKIGVAGILIDSYSFYPSLLNCDINAGDFGIIVQDSVNSGSSYPGEIIAQNLFVNAPYRTGVLLEGSSGVYLTDPQIGASRTGAGILTTTGFIGGLTIKGGYSNSNALDGVTLNSGSDSNIIGMQVRGNSASSPGINFGIRVGPSVTDFLISGNITGKLPGGSATQNYGVAIGPSSDRFCVTGNKTFGNVNMGVANSSGTSSTKIVTNNI